MVSGSLQWWEFAVRMGVALVLGSAIGVERQWRQRMAGLRTNALVATGSALFVMISVMTQGENSPTRIAAQVVSGIGFLGAGVIMRDGLNVRGLNTAATLWCAAAVGTLAGTGYTIQAAMGAIGILTANLLLRPLARRINQQPAGSVAEVETVYCVRAICRPKHEEHARTVLLQTLSANRAVLRALCSERSDDGTRTEVRAYLVCEGRDDPLVEQVVARLSLEASIKAASWEVVPDPDDPDGWPSLVSLSPLQETLPGGEEDAPVGTGVASVEVPECAREGAGRAPAVPRRAPHAAPRRTRAGGKAAGG